LVALGLAVTCPFLAIYIATILTEICTAFLATLCALAASLAMRSESTGRAIFGWILAGLAGGGATMCRPDAALFVFAVGGAAVLAGLFGTVRRWRSTRSAGDTDHGGGRAVSQGITRVILQGGMLTLGFALALAPWTIRNARIFGIFMPLAPPQANMPD